MEELKKIRLKLRIKYILIIALAITFSIFIIIFTKEYYSIILSISLILLALIFTNYDSNPEYKLLFKKIFVLKALESKFTDLIYKPDEGISFNKIEPTLFYNSSVVFYSEDYVSGKYKGIFFEQSDVEINTEQTTYTNGQCITTSGMRIFKGRWMIFDFNKPFKTNIQISQKGLANPGFLNYFETEEKRFKKVSTESENFNSNFNVYAQDEHEAFYILTPPLITTIEKIYDISTGKLSIYFINNQVHIAINNHQSSFEPCSVFQPINEQEIIEGISYDIDLITQFIDELNHNKELFI